MKLKIMYISGLGIALVLGYVMAETTQPKSKSMSAAMLDKKPSDASSRGSDLIIAAAYSTKCATSRGTCTLDTPKEVGAYCYCPGKGKGTVVR
jgi:hypothetical protein